MNKKGLFFAFLSSSSSYSNYILFKIASSSNQSINYRDVLILRRKKKKSEEEGMAAKNNTNIVDTQVESSIQIFTISLSITTHVLQKNLMQHIRYSLYEECKWRYTVCKGNQKVSKW